MSELVRETDREREREGGGGGGGGRCAKIHRNIPPLQPLRGDSGIT